MFVKRVFAFEKKGEREREETRIKEIYEKITDVIAQNVRSGKSTAVSHAWRASSRKNHACLARKAYIAGDRLA